MSPGSFAFRESFAKARYRFAVPAGPKFVLCSAATGVIMTPARCAKSRLRILIYPARQCAVIGWRGWISSPARPHARGQMLGADRQKKKAAPESAARWFGNAMEA